MAEAEPAGARGERRYRSTENSRSFLCPTLGPSPGGNPNSGSKFHKRYFNEIFHFQFSKGCKETVEPGKESSVLNFPSCNAKSLVLLEQKW
jgi:hypothetical protein